MQLSAANILIAAQQATKQVPQVPNAKAFASALADHANGDSFAPLDFKQTAAAPAPQPTVQKSAAPRLGGQIDIRI